MGPCGAIDHAVIDDGDARGCDSADADTAGSGEAAAHDGHSCATLLQLCGQGGRRKGTSSYLKKCKVAKYADEYPSLQLQHSFS